MIPNIAVNRRMMELLGLFVYGPYEGERMIVAHFTAELQGADIAQFTVYTPDVAGVYALSVYVVTVQNDGGTGAVTCTTYYTDAGGPAQQAAGMCDLTITGILGPINPLVLQAAAGQPIDIDTKNSGAYAAALYSIFVVLEFIRELP